MNIIPPHHPAATSDDEEDLKKILTGASTNPNEQPQPTSGIDGLQFEDPAPVVPTPAAKHAAAAPEAPKPPEPQPVVASAPAEPATPVVAAPASGDLEAIKKSALEELRPLVDKLNLSPEEKFDTLLLIIRSTDDQSLLAEAHQTAQTITDEAKRAEALLDIIKEIDYFSTQQPAVA